MEQTRNTKPVLIPVSQSISVDLLGGIKLKKGRRALSGFTTQKVIGLLCYLLENGVEPVSRDKLISIFWSESPEDQARYNLRYALWNIRKVFKDAEEEADLLITNRSICHVNPAVQLRIDTRILEQATSRQPTPETIVDLIQTLELYKGPFLDGFSLRNLPEWEEWLYRRREALHRAFLNGTESAGEFCLNSGQAATASGIYVRALTFIPDAERAHEGLIRAYAEMGKVSSAIRQFQNYCQLMKREFNAPPATTIVKLIDELQNGH